jgi:hypothetical protein
MPLLSLWTSNPEAISQLSVEQIVATAGDGVLRDGSESAKEFRQYLREVGSAKLADYAQHCLVSKFERSGLVLQDVINELGRRLGFDVSNGLYQGTASSIGYDGIWRGPEGQTIIVEVKTTDAYRISLETVAGYRNRLLDTEQVTGDTSILIVVGRQDTGDLEAQVRGSRHAWDIRIVSIESLTKLVRLKENSAEIETGSKIRSVFRPVEYTRLDGLVDVIFTAATDIEAQEPDDDSPTSGPVNATMPSSWEFTDAALLARKRDEIVDALSRKLDTRLLRNTRALYWSADHATRAVCTISKRYTKRSALPYWYAYHPQWDEFLSEASDGAALMVLGCMDLDVAFAIPRPVIHALLPDLNTTTVERGTYWHLHIAEPKSGTFELVVPRRDYLPLAPFQVPLAAISR